MRNVIGECPICKGELFVTKLKCNSCNTELSGEFTLSKFNHLSKEDLYFIEVFVKNRGSIKQVEKELGVSYPTVKKNLDDVITSLGYYVNEEQEEDKVDQDEILEKLSSGEITAAEAAKLLK
jgi:hypothetical protein